MNRDEIIAEDRVFRASLLYQRIKDDVIRLECATRDERIDWLLRLTEDEMGALNRAIDELTAQNPCHKPWCPFPYHHGLLEYMR